MDKNYRLNEDFFDTRHFDDFEDETDSVTAEDDDESLDTAFDYPWRFHFRCSPFKLSNPDTFYEKARRFRSLFVQMLELSRVITDFSAEKHLEFRFGYYNPNERWYTQISDEKDSRGWSIPLNTNIEGVWFVQDEEKVRKMIARQDGDNTLWFCVGFKFNIRTVADVRRMEIDVWNAFSIGLKRAFGSSIKPNAVMVWRQNSAGKQTTQMHFTENEVKELRLGGTSYCNNFFKYCKIFFPEKSYKECEDEARVMLSGKALLINGDGEQLSDTERKVLKYMSLYSESMTFRRVDGKIEVDCHNKYIWNAYPSTVIAVAKGEVRWCQNKKYHVIVKNLKQLKVTVTESYDMNYALESPKKVLKMCPGCTDVMLKIIGLGKEWVRSMSGKVWDLTKEFPGCDVSISVAESAKTYARYTTSAQPHIVKLHIKTTRGIKVFNIEVPPRR